MFVSALFLPYSSSFMYCLLQKFQVTSVLLQVYLVSKCLILKEPNLLQLSVGEISLGRNNTVCCSKNRV